MRESGRRVPIIQDCCDFFNMDLSMIQALKLKETVEEGLTSYRNIFRETKEQKVRQKLRYISIKLY